jgi:hypothetical protein
VGGSGCEHEAVGAGCTGQERRESEDSHRWRGVAGLERRKRNEENQIRRGNE